MRGAAAPPFVWIDGELRAAAEAVVRADDGAYQSGLGCYTTGRFEAGRVRHDARVATRLVRDGRTLGLPPIPTETVQRGLLELAESCFGHGSGIVRMQASADSQGTLHLIAAARPIGAEPRAWRVRSAPWQHEGPGPLSGVKLSGHPLMGLVRVWLRNEGAADEALLYDAEERLVEGSRSTPIVCRSDGMLSTPPLARGGVAGVARAIALEKLADLREVDISRDEVAEARELVMVNSVRGARCVSQLDGRSLSASPGPLCLRLSEALSQEA